MSPDGVLVYVTRDKGRVDVHSAIDGGFRFTFTPPRVRPNFFPVKCHSGIVFGSLGKKEFALYAVIDTPMEANVEATSRIVAISHPFNEVLFVSVPIAGIIQGTPVLSRGYHPGRFIFVTHNTNMMSTDETQPQTGHFSVLDTMFNGTVVFTESHATVASSADRIFPYGPVGISHNPTHGNYLGAGSNTNDIVVWTTSALEGRGLQGSVRGFQLPVGFEPGTIVTRGTTLFREVMWSAQAHPTLSKDGQSLFIGGRESDIRGWVDKNFTEPATWTERALRNDVRPALGKFRCY